jgi:hypothetical protein
MAGRHERLRARATAMRLPSSSAEPLLCRTMLDMHGQRTAACGKAAVWIQEARELGEACQRIFHNIRGEAKKEGHDPCPHSNCSLAHKSEQDFVVSSPRYPQFSSAEQQIEGSIEKRDIFVDGRCGNVEKKRLQVHIEQENGSSELTSRRNSLAPILQRSVHRPKAEFGNISVANITSRSTEGIESETKSICSTPAPSSPNTSDREASTNSSGANIPLSSLFDTETTLLEEYPSVTPISSPSISLVDVEDLGDVETFNLYSTSTVSVECSFGHSGDRVGGVEERCTFPSSSYPELKSIITTARQLHPSVPLRCYLKILTCGTRLGMERLRLKTRRCLLSTTTCFKPLLKKGLSGTSLMFGPSKAWSFWSSSQARMSDCRKTLAIGR